MPYYSHSFSLAHAVRALHRMGLYAVARWLCGAGKNGTDRAGGESTALHHNLAGVKVSQEYSVLSIVGVHANEKLQSIFDRKRKDIDACGKTYWMISVSSCLAAKVNEVCAVKKAGIPILFLSAGIGKARPTTRETVFHGILNADAAHVSFPSGLSEVTGKPGNTAYALELSAIDLCGEDRMLDTWNYEDLLARTRNVSVKFRLGYSTSICRHIAPVPGMKSRMRKIIAMGQVLGCYKLWP